MAVMNASLIEPFSTAPTETSRQSSVVPTRDGVLLISRPHVHRLPSRLSPAEATQPAAMDFQSVSVPTRSGADTTSFTMPRPVWPHLLSPQAHKVPSALRASE